ncbi:MAG: peptidoglycan editing factor PgeF [Lachnospiraceae bacterium]
MEAMKEMNWVIKKQKSTLHLREKFEVPFFQFEHLEKSGAVIHGFSTRMGGVSRGDCATMNLSFEREDDEHSVRTNYELLAAAIGFSTDSLVFSRQTHTANVRVVTEDDRGKGFLYPRDYTDVDGLITNVPGITLATFYADCVPLFLADPVTKVIGLSHSGWKGTVEKIGRVTVEKMQEVYGSDPKDILAAIGPSICQSCYEVSEDVIEQFRQAFSEELWPELFYAKGNGKYQLNLWRANERIFEEAGILKEHLSTTNICTCCNPGYLFSHRASKGRRGNLGAFLQLKP